MISTLVLTPACGTATEDGAGDGGLDRAKQATVRVTAHGPADNGGPTFFGSGVVVGNGTQIITASHVVAGAERLEVRAEGRRSVSARLLGASVCEDLALLEVDEALASISIGGSVQTGDEVYAIGYPQGGRSQALTAGIVSRVGETVSAGDSVIRDALQTDAALNPGNSGGPLVSVDGSLVGINVAGFDPGDLEGVGVAVPISTVEALRADLSDRGEDDWHGMRLTRVSSDAASTAGLRVDTVEDGSAADEARIEPGDVLTVIDNRSVTEPGTQWRCDESATERSEVQVILNRNDEWYAATIGTSPVRRISLLPGSGGTLRSDAYLADLFAFPFLVNTADEWVSDLHLPGATVFRLDTVADSPVYVAYLVYEPNLSVEETVERISESDDLVTKTAEPVMLGVHEALAFEVVPTGDDLHFVEILPGLTWQFEPNYRDLIYVVDVGGGTAVIDIQVPAGDYDRVLPYAIRLVESTKFVTG
ncbi:MAG: trypsin-like peptidase domain-containing protein [Halobacteriales archaeon]|nr:trypsin-like peptidase domain-containing protein [Halobacteriales archaeon]